MSRIQKTVCLASVVAGDVAALFSSFIIAYFIRSHILIRHPSLQFDPLPLEIQLKTGFPLAAFIVVAIFAFARLYTRRLPFWEETRLLLRGTALSFVLLMMVVFISRSYTEFSRAVILMAGLLSLVLIPLIRLAVKKILFRLAIWKKKVLILGTNSTARAIAMGIRENPTLGYEIAGFLTENKNAVGQTMGDDLNIIGEIDDVEKISLELGVRDIIIALPSIGKDRFNGLVEKSDKLAESLRIVPSFGSIFTMGVEIENLGDVLTLCVTRNLAKPWNISIKRTFEFVFTLVLFVLSLPLMLLIALAIKIDTRGPVLFSQERMSANGKKIRIFKFRSMYTDADSRLTTYLERNPKARLEWENYQKLKDNDPRLTRVGKFIRNYSLDEIPQLINVVRGEMSLVGPRPYLPREMEKIGPTYKIISRVKPGITGLWQVSGRSLLSFKERLMLDEYYIRNWSLWLDIVILLKTVKVVARQEGAF